MRTGSCEENAGICSKVPNKLSSPMRCNHIFEDKLRCPITKVVDSSFQKVNLATPLKILRPTTESELRFACFPASTDVDALR